MREGGECATEKKNANQAIKNNKIKKNGKVILFCNKKSAIAFGVLL